MSDFYASPQRRRLFSKSRKLSEHENNTRNRYKNNNTVNRNMQDDMDRMNLLSDGEENPNSPQSDTSEDFNLSDTESEVSIICLHEMPVTPSNLVRNASALAHHLHSSIHDEGLPTEGGCTCTLCHPGANVPHKTRAHNDPLRSLYADDLKFFSSSPGRCSSDDDSALEMDGKVSGLSLIMEERLGGVIDFSVDEDGFPKNVPRDRCDSAVDCGYDSTATNSPANSLVHSPAHSPAHLPLEPQLLSSRTFPTPAASSSSQLVSPLSPTYQSLPINDTYLSPPLSNDSLLSTSRQSLRLQLTPSPQSLSSALSPTSSADILSPNQIISPTTILSPVFESMPVPRMSLPPLSPPILMAAPMTSITASQMPVNPFSDMVVMPDILQQSLFKPVVLIHPQQQQQQQQYNSQQQQQLQQPSATLTTPIIPPPSSMTSSFMSSMAQQLQVSMPQTDTTSMPSIFPQLTSLLAPEAPANFKAGPKLTINGKLPTMSAPSTALTRAPKTTSFSYAAANAPLNGYACSMNGQRVDFSRRGNTAFTSSVSSTAQQQPTNLAAVAAPQQSPTLTQGFNELLSTLLDESISNGKNNNGINNMPKKLNSNINDTNVQQNLILDSKRDENNIFQCLNTMGDGPDTGPSQADTDYTALIRKMDELKENNSFINNIYQGINYQNNNHLIVTKTQDVGVNDNTVDTNDHCYVKSPVKKNHDSNNLLCNNDGKDILDDILSKTAPVASSAGGFISFNDIIDNSSQDQGFVEDCDGGSDVAKVTNMSNVSNKLIAALSEGTKKSVSSSSSLLQQLGITHASDETKSESHQRQMNEFHNKRISDKSNYAQETSHSNHAMLSEKDRARKLKKEKRKEKREQERKINRQLIGAAVSQLLKAANSVATNAPFSPPASPEPSSPEPSSLEPGQEKKVKSTGTGVDPPKVLKPFQDILEQVALGAMLKKEPDDSEHRQNRKKPSSSKLNDMLGSSRKSSSLMSSTSSVAASVPSMDSPTSPFTLPSMVSPFGRRIRLKSNGHLLTNRESVLHNMSNIPQLPTSELSESSASTKNNRNPQSSICPSLNGPCITPLAILLKNAEGRQLAAFSGAKVEVEEDDQHMIDEAESMMEGMVEEERRIESAAASLIPIMVNGVNFSAREQAMMNSISNQQPRRVPIGSKRKGQQMEEDVKEARKPGKPIKEEREEDFSVGYDDGRYDTSSVTVGVDKALLKKLRSRNRKAARRSRQKQMFRISKLEKEVCDMTRKNASIENSIFQRLTEVKQLSNLLQNHKCKINNKQSNNTPKTQQRTQQQSASRLLQLKQLSNLLQNHRSPTL